jgi:hypothetical protein
MVRASFPLSFGGPSLVDRDRLRTRGGQLERISLSGFWRAEAARRDERVAICRMQLRQPRILSGRAGCRPERRRRLDDVEGFDLQPPTGAIREVVNRSPPEHRAYNAPAPFKTVFAVWRGP